MTHLSDALARHPDAGLVVYGRVSSWGQAGPGKVRLEEKVNAVVDAVCELAPGKLRYVVSAIEEGTLSVHRPKLCDASEYAHRRNCIVAASDLSRFIRAAAYSRTTNRNAWPTAKEFDRLHELTLGVPLATVESPLLGEDERHSRATRRTGRAGRPRAIDDALAVRIWGNVDAIFRSDNGQVWWVPSLRELARCFRVSPATILRLLYSPSPTGKTWLDLFQERGGWEPTPTGFYLSPSRRVAEVVSKRTE